MGWSLFLNALPKNLKKFDGLMEFPTDHPVEQCIRIPPRLLRGNICFFGKNPSPNSRFQPHFSHNLSTTKFSSQWKFGSRFTHWTINEKHVCQKWIKIFPQIYGLSIIETKRGRKHYQTAGPAIQFLGDYRFIRVGFQHHQASTAVSHQSSPSPATKLGQQSIRVDTVVLRKFLASNHHHGSGNKSNMTLVLWRERFLEGVSFPSSSSSFWEKYGTVEEPPPHDLNRNPSSTQRWISEVEFHWL